MYVPPIDLQKNPPAGGQPPPNRSTGKPGTIKDSILDAQQALDGRYQLWGRKIEYDFVTYSGTDEAAQRADAVTVAAKKPFAVVDSAGGTVFSTEIAKRKIVMAFGSTGSQAANLAQQPYRFTGSDADLQAKNIAAWLGKQIAGKKAQFAGDPDFQIADAEVRSPLHHLPDDRAPPSTSTSSRPTSPSRACPSSRSRSRGPRRPTPRRAPRRRRPRSRHRRSSRSSRTPASPRSS